MYKTRIKYWGLAKNLTANEVHSILRTYRTHIAADNAKPTVFIRGRPIDSEKVERYLRRTTKDFPDLIAPSEGEGHQDQPLVAVLSPHQLRSPDVFKLPEEIIFLSNQLAAGSRENGLVGVFPSYSPRCLRPSLLKLVVGMRAKDPKLSRDESH